MAAATATATAEKKTAALDELLLALGEADCLPVAAAIAKSSEQLLSLAWLRGLVEFGKTKHCVTGNPDVPESKPTLVIEDGVEWTGPKTARHGRLRDVLGEAVPRARFYQKYQLEVCVQKDKDVWEWLEAPDAARGRDTRWARRDIDRAEAETAFGVFVRLTDKGNAELQGE